MYKNLYTYLKSQRKLRFFNLFTNNNKYWIYIQNVTNVEECSFISEKYSSVYDKTQFISYIKFNIMNLYQIQAETWKKWVMLHCIGFHLK